MWFRNELSSLAEVSLYSRHEFRADPLCVNPTAVNGANVSLGMYIDSLGKLQVQIFMFCHRIILSLVTQVLGQALYWRAYKNVRPVLCSAVSAGNWTTHRPTESHSLLMYLLNAIGLTPGGSSTVHIYTQTVHRTIHLTTLVGRLSGIRTHSGQTKINDELTA